MRRVVPSDPRGYLEIRGGHCYGVPGLDAVPRGWDLARRSYNILGFRGYWGMR